MVEACDLWVKIFVIAFILIAGLTTLVLILQFFTSVFLKGGNILYANQKRTIEILKERLNKYEND